MKRVLLSALVLSVAAMGTQAKSWKIGPSSVNGMDFASINDAVESEKVAAGDTLFLDQYYSTNVKQIVTKKVVIIGTGYDTSFTDEKVVATLTDSLILKVDGIQIKSVKLNNVKFYADECVLDRCYVYGGIKIGTIPKGLNHLYSCYISGQFCYIGSQVSVKTITNTSTGGSTTTYYNAQFDIQNCVVYHTDTGDGPMKYLTNSIINNNTIIYKTSSSSTSKDNYCFYDITNSQITNNIIYGYNSSGYSNYNGPRCMNSDLYVAGSGNAIEHNVMNQSVPGNYPNNICIGNSLLNIFTQTGNFSDYYKLRTDVSDIDALTYATDGGEVGCHGGMFGCPSGGRPQYIPYFSKVMVGSRTENGKLPVSVTIKIQDK